MQERQAGDFVRALLSAGAKVNLQTNSGGTPLLTACNGGYLETVHTLLSAGAKVDLQNHMGATPLFVACGRGHVEVARALLSAGAKVDMQTLDGVSPLFMACEGGHVEALALLSAGASVDLQDNHGRSPLMRACLHGHMEVVRALLFAGARADLRDDNSRTPLDVLPTTLRPEVERTMQQVRDEKALARNRNVGTASNMDPGPTAVDTHERDHDKPAGSRDGGACPLQGNPGYLPAEGGSSSGRAGSVRVCADCGGAPSAGAKLRACGHCMSVRYCSAACQAEHWREGGHKEACPRLRDIRARKKAAEGSG